MKSNDPFSCPLWLLGLIALAGLLGSTPNASAQIKWRVSVKFFLNANGNRAISGNINQDSEIQDQIDTANNILDTTGRGIRLELIEIIDLNGLEEWFDVTPDASTRNLLNEEAKASKAAFAWHDNAINIYITGAPDGGFAGYCSRVADHDIILLRQNVPDVTFVHEIGHFMGLCHTQGCQCAGCGEDEEGCTKPGSDKIDDTLPDLPCWDADAIAIFSYGQDYGLLSPAEKLTVDQVLFNVMSYHDSRFLFTPDQSDHQAQTANLSRLHVANGATIFVRPGVLLPFLFQAGTVGLAEIFAGSYGTESVVLIESGTYEEGLTLTEPVTYRATRGDVILK